MTLFFSWILRLTRRARASASFAVLALAMTVLPSPAMADGPAKPAISEQPATPGEVGLAILKIITAVAETVVEAFEGLVKNEALYAGGKTITYTLFAVVFAWNLIKSG